MYGGFITATTNSLQGYTFRIVLYTLLGLCHTFWVVLCHYIHDAAAMVTNLMSDICRLVLVLESRSSYLYHLIVSVERSEVQYLYIIHHKDMDGTATHMPVHFCIP